MSSFGKLYRTTTFGESHSPAVGCIIEGFPSKFKININQIQHELNRRRPGQSPISTPRNEKDKLTILSGLENEITLGSPICGIVYNNEFKPDDYIFSENEYIPRPSHADYSYISKYGIHASSGGGRSSARETIGRVISGSIAYQYLNSNYGIEIVAWVSKVGEYEIEKHTYLDTITREQVDSNMIRCPNKEISEKMISYIKDLKNKGDSTGGIVTCVIRNCKEGIGEPCFDKLEAELGKAMMSIPATKGFEIGSGFNSSSMKGSQHNDSFILHENKLRTITNRSGGVQGGISNGENIYFNIAFKPPATISLPQNTCTLSGKKTILEAKGRHDPCVVNRAVPIVESMASIVILDHILQQKRFL